MKKAFLVLIAMAFVMAGTAFAEPCAEVDVELPATVVAEPGAFADGYFELTNCGDEAATFWLTFNIAVADVDFDLGGMPVMLGAGETISREFHFPVPAPAAGYTVTLCASAVVDDYEVTDCAEMAIEGPGGDGAFKTFDFYMASEGECVDVDLELPDTVYAEAGSFAEGYFELTNCGDEAATVMLSVSLDMDLFDTTITMGDIPVEMGAGETISREFRFPVPPIVPDGTFGICVTATSGEAMMTACQTVVIINENFGGSTVSEDNFDLNNFPNPFNPSTTISFELAQPSNVSLNVYNVLGRKVATLVDDNLDAGAHVIEWDSRDVGGTTVASGIYFYQLQVEDEVVTKKMMIVK